MNYPDDFINKIICGDCLDALKNIPDESIDVTITSPPYNINLKYDEYVDNISNEKYLDFSRKWIKEIYRITKNSGRFYVILSDKLLWEIKPLSEIIGWSFVQLLFWGKPNFASGGKLVLDWSPMSENILLFRKGKRNPMLSSSISANTYNWFIEAAPQTNYKKDFQKKIHPAQIPVNLIRKILSRTPGEVILDPFCGSGSVCIASKELKRNYIGIEISDEYCEATRDRLKINCEQ